MPKKGHDKEKKLITDNLSEVANEILQMVNDISVKGRERTIKIFTDASIPYNAKYQSYLWGWCYSLVSNRENPSNAFEEIISELKEAKTGFLCKQRVCLFLCRSHGDMPATSANFYLLKELLIALPHYQSETDTELSHILPRLKTLIIEKFQEEDDSLLEKIKEQEEALAQLEAEQERIKADARKIMLVDGNKATSDSIVKIAGKEIFLINKDSNNCRIEWLNPYGKKIKVILLENLFVNEKYSSLADLEADKENFQSFKHALATWLNYEKKSIKIEVYSDKIPVNRENSFQFNINTNTIVWINSVGNVIPVIIEDYPLLAELIASNHEWEKEETLEQLTVLLMGVETRSQISAEEKSLKNQMIFQENIACYFADSMEKASQFCKKDGVYSVIKTEGFWQVYIGQGNEAVALTGDNWEPLHEKLNGYQSLSAKSLKEKHENEIKNDIIAVTKQKYLCRVIENFNPEKISNLWANSIALVPKENPATEDNNESKEYYWEIYYIRGNLTGQRLDLSELPEKARHVLNDWTCNKESIHDIQKRYTFTEAMNAFTAPHLATKKLTGNYAAIEKILRAQLQKKKGAESSPQPEPETDCDKTPAPKDQSAPKLDREKYADIIAILEQRSTDKSALPSIVNKSHSEIDSSSKPSPVPPSIPADSNTGEINQQTRKISGKIAIPSNISKFFGAQKTSAESSTIPVPPAIPT